MSLRIMVGHTFVRWHTSAAHFVPHQSDILMDPLIIILRTIGHVSDDADAVAFLDRALAAFFNVRGTVLESDTFNEVRR